ncbi:methyl-accepting chemotaxis protein [Pseudoalteromonas peptidolytica]|uniref:Methyl-accepting chemotaxis protein n=1 Tax=Pseudoalteromonas peptidolytica F12-50-A1 TaxID=1315280 RepID=A0A8I0T706_9GAMM|nr:methyl-accepting chemotaxis protein [Pseudoalteromonas peptidolytica]MBE0347749.1 methyl-accepting chemotaxis protein [Pseudoalteromonas peptidolytica F12-50-A1]NLR16077.1 methyl-accepting chemotaxis protein [Pseudoalteromonas peptidolytica]GEK11126.1 methyl-accepting chemotaxis protein [Pseudoalteromonas peptidolytica]
MKQASIKNKLLFFVTVLVTSLVVILVATMWFHLAEENAKQSKGVQQAIYDEISQGLVAKANQYGQRVSGFVNEAYRVPYTLAGILSHTSKENPLSREQVQEVVFGALEQNRFVSSMYAQFEPNGYDGDDTRFTEGASHSVVKSGTLELYFTQESTGPVQQKVESAEAKYLDNINEFGLREAEWYLCAKDKVAPCIMEPYLYEISAGNEMLMTSLTVPVVVNRQFKGLVGVDVNLPIFQTLVDELSDSLYSGAAKVTLLSDLGLVVGSSHYDKLARPLAESTTTEHADVLQSLHKGSGIEDLENDLVVSVPINIKLPNTTWSLVIELPKAIALESATTLQSQLEESANSVGRWMLTIGVVIAAIGIAIAFVLVNTIIGPLTHIQKRVENLASSEGDLTHELEVSHHAELIALAQGFNRFTEKLRNMIDDLKGLAESSYEQSHRTTEAAINIKNKVANQHLEIDSVVTAINELSATASEVARASEKAAASTNQAADQVQQSEQSIIKTTETVQSMADQVIDAKQAVVKVSERSDDISKILEVIRAIAEQTNLLALNAAIEAARAGEQGRGFAVVADEVRALASKTQASTDDISKLIDNLQSEVANSGRIIESSVKLGEDAVSYCQESARLMSTLVGELTSISNEVTQIATAAEEQSMVTEEINTNTTGISDAAAELSQFADEVELAASSMTQIVEQKHKQLNLLRT